METMVDVSRSVSILPDLDFVNVIQDLFFRMMEQAVKVKNNIFQCFQSV